MGSSSWGGCPASMPQCRWLSHLPIRPELLRGLAWSPLLDQAGLELCPSDLELIKPSFFPHSACDPGMMSRLQLGLCCGFR
jgi:hypothetical protein